MVLRLIFRMLVVAWSLAAALQEDSLYIQGKDQTGNKHPLHPYGEFDFRKDSYSFVCGANSEITEAKAKAIAILCQVRQKRVRFLYSFPLYSFFPICTLSGTTKFNQNTPPAILPHP